MAAIRSSFTRRYTINMMNSKYRITTLYFMDAANMKRCDMPALLKEKLAQYFIQQ